MPTTWYEQSERQIVHNLLEKRFGPLSGVARERLFAMSSEQLEELATALLHASSLRKLKLQD